MKYLLDTCCISELVKPKPQPTVVEWIHATNERSMFISVLTLGELQKGVSKLKPSKKRTLLQHWIDNDLNQRFEGRKINVTTEVATLWGKIQAQAEGNGKKLPVMDSLIAATALANDLIVVTRNLSDIEAVVECVNPWKAA